MSPDEAPPSRKRRPIALADSDDEIEADDNSHLHKKVAVTTVWEGTRRRQKEPSSEAHLEVMKHCSKVLIQ
jgi:hypothetical protein